MFRVCVEGIFRVQGFGLGFRLVGVEIKGLGFKRYQGLRFRFFSGCLELIAVPVRL